MKKMILFSLCMLMLTGCATQQATSDTSAMYTQAAKTVFVQLTQAGALTPTLTPTHTLAPTPTVTMTPVPSPTPIPPTATWAVVPAGKVTVPIMLYLQVAGSTADDPNYQWDSYGFVPPIVFKQQLEVLKNSGYNTVTISQVADVVRKGGSLPPRPVALTFDAANISLYTKVFPIMKEMGFVGTVYAVVARIDVKDMMSTAQLKELAAAGWEIGSKGMTGIDITSNHDQAGYEISTSRTELASKLGLEVKSFSYPFGKVDSIVNGARVSEWGYLSAAGLGRSSDINPNDLYYLPRYEIRRDMTIDVFAANLPFRPDSLPTQVVVTKQVK